MSAYLIGQITVKDQVLWQEYVQGVKESLENFEAAILMRGQKKAVLSGNNPTSLAVVIAFKDYAELQAWYASVKYQVLIPLRDKVANVTITTYEESE